MRGIGPTDRLAGWLAGYLGERGEIGYFYSFFLGGVEGKIPGKDTKTKTNQPLRTSKVLYIFGFLFLSLRDVKVAVLKLAHLVLGALIAGQTEPKICIVLDGGFTDGQETRDERRRRPWMEDGVAGSLGWVGLFGEIRDC